MKTVTAVVMLVLALWARPAPAQEADDSLGSRRQLAAAGYRHDDAASLIRALEDENELIAVFATNFLERQASTPEIVAALRTASEGPRELVAKAAFDALQALGATGWEGSALGLMQSTRDDSVRLQLAGTLARAGRSEGWVVVREALTPDHRSMGLALRSVGAFHGLKGADGASIDAIAEIRRLQRDMPQRGRFVDDQIAVSIAEANRWGRERARAR